ncbi:sugar phosphate isomerase/epimerase family protein [Thermodesulfobacteriota bacterium]
MPCMVVDNNIQIGFNGRFFPSNWRPALDELGFAQTNGFLALQFPGKEDGLMAEHLGDELPIIRNALASAGITAVMEIIVLVDGTGCTTSGDTPLDILTANLPAILSLPCRYVHWHLVPSILMDAETARALEEKLLPQFSAGVALANNYNFGLGLEHNEPDLLLFGTPESCAQALAAVPGLGFVWDFNHTIPDHIDAFQTLVPVMNMLHVSDTPLPEVNYHLPLGLGTIELVDYCRALRAGNFAGPAILEIGGLPKSGGYGRDTDGALVDSATRLKQANEASAW